MTDTQAAPLPMVLETVTVARVDRVSPSFVRVELAGEEVGEVGVDGPLLDQRIKLIFPNAAGALGEIEPGPDWWTDWSALPDDERGAMRTYTIRDVVGTGADARLVVDVVVHDPTEHSGPGNDWARAAAVGDRLVLVAPRRGHGFGGIEFDAGAAQHLLLVGDETAAPAVYGILRDLRAAGSEARGCALLEVPTSDDVLDDVAAPDGVEVVWLPRDGAPRGARLREATLQRLEDDPDLAAATAADDEVPADVWETPAYSASGEPVVPAKPAVPTTLGEGGPHPGLYAWIAGESKVVTGLRRHLVKDLGLARDQVAFMGYWREGVAMRG